MKDKNLLKRALVANAMFSGLTGSGALVLAGSLSGSLGPPSWSLRALGAGLLVFAALVANEARAPGKTGTKQIIAADVGWVIGAAAIIVLAPSWLTTAGQMSLVGVTAVVAVVAAAQWRGLAATA